MKVYCGTGGTLIGEDIQLQGDMVNKSIGFLRNETEVKELLKKMKVYCGTGGTLIGEDIQLQGDMVNKSIDFLRDEGFQNI